MLHRYAQYFNHLFKNELGTDDFSFSICSKMYKISRCEHLSFWSPDAISPNLHCVSKKLPPFNCLWLCQILIDFKIFCTAGKRMKFSTKPMWHYSPHLKHVAALSWEIKNSNFCRCGRKCKQIASLIAFNFVIHPQILIFSVFKIASVSLYWFQIKFSMSLLFYLLHFAWVVAKCIVVTRVCLYVCLCVYVHGRMPTLLHRPGCNLGNL